MPDPKRQTPSRVAKTAPVVTPADPDAQADAPPAVPVWADDLIAALAKTGTGAGKLAVITRAKVDRYEYGETADEPEFDDLGDPNPKRVKTTLPSEHPQRHLTARQALKKLLADPEVSDLTKDKARQLCRTGQYAPAAVGPAKIDAHVPPPPEAAPPQEEWDDEGEDTDEWEPKGDETESGADREPDADEGDSEPEAGGDGLEELTVAQLRETAAGEGVVTTSSSKKAEIVQAIRDARAARAGS